MSIRTKRFEIQMYYKSNARTHTHQNIKQKKDRNTLESNYKTEKKQMKRSERGESRARVKLQIRQFIRYTESKIEVFH